MLGQLIVIQAVLSTSRYSFPTDFRGNGTALTAWHLYFLPQQIFACPILAPRPLTAGRLLVYEFSLPARL